MDDTIAQQAINAALTGEWGKAVTLNSDILAQEPTNIDALNRISIAYAQLGKPRLAITSAKKVLVLDPLNTIAAKNLARYKANKKITLIHLTNASGDMFLEIPGKTRIITLVNLGEPTHVNELAPGDKVNFQVHTHKICVNAINGKYIGRIPDDLSARLRSLIRGGNRYLALVKVANDKQVKIFVKEIRQSPKLRNTPSFPTEKMAFAQFTSPLESQEPDNVVEDQDASV